MYRTLKHRGTRAAVTALVGVSLLVMPGTAQASKLRRGFYHCWNASGPEGGTIKIRSQQKYSVHGDVGRYVHKSGTKWIKFKSGPLSGGWLKGKHIVKDGTHIIEKWAKLDGDKEWWYMSTCSRDEKS